MLKAAHTVIKERKNFNPSLRAITGRGQIVFLQKTNWRARGLNKTRDG